MPNQPAEVTLEVSPRARFDVIDVNERIAENHGDLLQRYPRALYFSYHTTAGYLEQSMAARLNHSREGVEPFIEVFKALFPEGADYRHDQMDLRAELSEAQKAEEPRNADSHLAYIGSGLRSCVTYLNRTGAPVYFIDLDGVNQGKSRKRQTSVIAYTREHLAKYKCPTSVEWIDALPRNASGKILKKDLRAPYWEGRGRLVG